MDKKEKREIKKGKKKESSFESIVLTQRKRTEILFLPNLTQ